MSCKIKNLLDKVGGQKLMSVLMMLMILTSVSTAQAKDLVIVGTGSSAGILEALGRAFTEQNPEIKIIIPPSIGSTGGIKAVGNGDYIVGRIARELTEKEQRHGLIVLPIAKVPIVFFVNASVPLEGITSDQVCKIYGGTTRKWEELGAGQGKIRVIRREGGDSSLAVLQKSMAGFAEKFLTRRAKTTYSDSETVNEARQKKNTIAFGAWPNTMAVTEINVLKLDGFHPTENEYPYTGGLCLVYKEKNNNGALEKFIHFLSTQNAKQAIIDAGGLPVE